MAYSSATVDQMGRFASSTEVPPSDCAIPGVLHDDTPDGRRAGRSAILVSMESAEGSPSTDTVSRRPPEDDRRSVRTDAFWIGPVEGKLMAWLTQPPAGPGDVGVVIVPPLGYESFTTHRTVRALAERLALIGCSVVRIDLDGTGDSWGEPWDPDRVLSWRASLHEAATFLTGIGCRSLVVAGVRFGATLALTEGADMGADRALAWPPSSRAGPSCAN